MRIDVCDLCEEPIDWEMWVCTECHSEMCESCLHPESDEAMCKECFEEQQAEEES